MKLLKNVYEYRDWMIKDFLHLDDTFPSVFEPDEIEIDILRQAPKEFPCLVQLVEDESGNYPQFFQFIYRSQVEEWARLFGIVR
ncbi:hypothetical protein J1785_07530 [Rahnella sp. SL6]|uniref:hypothetical protein n=1 Tax=Rahnella perminowiae TaxID=2816244 RepID=UPI001C269AA0|nr:hypothetical protein [Rahnella perminowiae]MBU9809598.1 hypothetical protein [Rahnella perminowiae]MBU9824530.1 hypothetical protein [Rahnella perminowiae]MCR9003469.1 hypothetical protein [Rahnella perminowiae]MCX2945266.1 hypothetical protein [Rahnella perminowiae]